MQKKIDSSHINSEEAMHWLSHMLQEMKKTLNEVDMFFKKNKINPEKIHVSQEKINHMHDVYNQINTLANQYSKSKDWVDLNTACSKTELLEPGFELNYGEIMDNAKAAGYQFPH